MVAGGWLAQKNPIYQLANPKHPQPEDKKPNHRIDISLLIGFIEHEKLLRSELKSNQIKLMKNRTKID